jgi:hypothetical protein
LGRLLKSRLNFPHKCPIRQIRMANTHNSILNGGDSESRGSLIVLEGLDRSGKTSQSSRLLTYLEGLGHSAELWRFPDRNTNVGQMISSYLSNKSQLDDHTIHLLFSANRWEKRFVMLFLCSMLCSGLTDFVYNLKYLVSSNSSSLLVLRIRKKKILVFDNKALSSNLKCFPPLRTVWFLKKQKYMVLTKPVQKHCSLCFLNLLF